MPLYRSLVLLFLLFVSSSLILSFRYSLFVSESSVSFMSYIDHIIFIWLGFCNHCTLACFHLSNNFEDSSWNRGLCCINSSWPRLTDWNFDVLSNIFRSLVNVNVVIQDFQSCKYVWDFHLKLFLNFCVIWLPEIKLLHITFMWLVYLPIGSFLGLQPILQSLSLSAPLKVGTSSIFFIAFFLLGCN